ncbi:MAG: class I SAM-dependent methyltransferase [Nitrospirae bacterium]|nr:class I SAM-dependent methyltransferase [Nitrospirota bacterium]
MQQVVWFWILTFLLVLSVAGWLVNRNRESRRKSEAESLIPALKGNLLGPTPWCVDFVHYNGTIFELRGWALPPKGDHGCVTFTLNGVEMQTVVYPIPRPDIAEIFSFHPGADRAAFRASSVVSPEEAFREGYATIACVDRKTLLPITEGFEFYFPDDGSASQLPDPDRRIRVSGSDDADLFRLVGYSAYHKIERVLMRSYGKKYGDFDSLLDWGCGCGRFLRYFSESRKPAVTGVDIDRSNIDWGRKHLLFARFETVPLRPPTGLKNEQFDLIIGISVMTHLRLSDQLLWLEELARVAKPGAVVLLTTLGPASVSRLPVPLDQFQKWTREGSIYYRDNDNLKGYIEDDDYYGSAYVTPDFIRDAWSRYFQVEEILPAYIGNHQDLVVLRKPTGT